MYTEVTGDLLDITGRLREINPLYRVFSNNKVNRLEVHIDSCPNAWTLAFVVPYDNLDSRTLDYARKTCRQNADLIESEILLNNSEVAASAERSLRRTQIQLRDMLGYANQVGHLVNFTKNYLKEF